MEPPDVIYIGKSDLSKENLKKFKNMVSLLNWSFDNGDYYLFDRATKFIKSLII